MNSDDNNPQTNPATSPSPVGATPPDIDSVSEPNLPASDQADIANAIDQLASAAGGSIPSVEPSAPTTPESLAAPEALTTSEAPESSEAPTIPAATEAPESTATPESLAASESPEPLATPESPEAPTIPAATESAPVIPEVATPSDDSTEGTQAEAVDVPEEPLKPANPVPGSFGSAINYSETAPDHSEPNPATKKHSLFSAIKKTKDEKDKPADTQTDTQAADTQAADTQTGTQATDNTAAPDSIVAPDSTVAVTTDAPAPDTSAPATPPVAEPLSPREKKQNSLILAAIILSIVALIAVIVVIILIAALNPFDDKTTTVETENTSYEAPEDNDVVLTCNRISTAADLASDTTGLASFEQKLVANYYNDELSDLTTTDAYTYTDADSAAQALQTARSNYSAKYVNLGLNLDPFDSAYPQKDNTFNVTHFAEYEDIDSTNAPLLYLSVDANGGVATDIDSVIEAYTSRGYTCSRSDNEEKYEPKATSNPTEDSNVTAESANGSASSSENTGAAAESSTTSDSAEDSELESEDE